MGGSIVWEQTFSIAPIFTHSVRISACMSLISEGSSTKSSGRNRFSKMTVTCKMDFRSENKLATNWSQSCCKMTRSLRDGEYLILNCWSFPTEEDNTLYMSKFQTSYPVCIRPRSSDGDYSGKKDSGSGKNTWDGLRVSSKPPQPSTFSATLAFALVFLFLFPFFFATYWSPCISNFAGWTFIVLPMSGLKWSPSAKLHANFTCKPSEICTKIAPALLESHGRWRKMCSDP